MEHLRICTLAMALDTTVFAVAAGVGIALLAVVYFGVRFWMVSTRPPDISDVPTPNIDRLNRKALEHMAEETAEQDEAETIALQDEEPPADLKAVVPEEDTGEKK